MMLQMKQLRAGIQKSGWALADRAPPLKFVCGAVAGTFQRQRGFAGMILHAPKGK